MIKEHKYWSRYAIYYGRQPEEAINEWSSQICEFLVVSSVNTELNGSPELHKEHVGLVIGEDS